MRSVWSGMHTVSTSGYDRIGTGSGFIAGGVHAARLSAGRRPPQRRSAARLSAGPPSQSPLAPSGIGMPIPDYDPEIGAKKCPSEP